MRKEELNSLEFSFLWLMHYVNTTERQIIKFSSKDVGNYNLGITIKQKDNYIMAYYFYTKC